MQRIVLLMKAFDSFFSSDFMVRGRHRGPQSPNWCTNDDRGEDVEKQIQPKNLSFIVSTTSRKYPNTDVLRDARTGQFSLSGKKVCAETEYANIFGSNRPKKSLARLEIQG
jgi:hypothetical protein